MSLTILSVNTASDGGGAERAARECHRGYLAAGADAWLAVGRAPGLVERTLQIPNRASRTRWARAWLGAADFVPARGAGFRVRRAMRGALAEPLRWARTQLGEEDFHHPATAHLLGLTPRRPNVLHLHNLHGGYFDLRELPALSAQVPTIATLHDAWLLSGHCSHSLSCERWESGCGACPALWTYPAVPRDRTAWNWERKREIYSRSALHVGVPSEWLADRVRRSMLIPGARAVRVIPHGIDLTRFTPGDRAAARRELGLDPARALVISLASAVQRRGWRDAEAFRGALKHLSGPAAAADWVLLGESGADVRIGAVALRRLGRVEDDARLALWYRAADLYVHAARADTFPYMVIESLACGTPVVASRVGGIPEQVRGAAFVDGVAGFHGPSEATGLLVQPFSATALRTAIEGYFAIPEAGRQAMGANAARDAAVRFDATHTVRAYLAWARELAGMQ